MLYNNIWSITSSWWNNLFLLKKQKFNYQIDDKNLDPYLKLEHNKPRKYGLDLLMSALIAIGFLIFSGHSLDFLCYVTNCNVE